MVRLDVLQARLRPKRYSGSTKEATKPMTPNIAAMHFAHGRTSYPTLQLSTFGFFNLQDING
eukprot:1155310-Pelagomonas_calceolata.AAC.7